MSYSLRSWKQPVCLVVFAGFCSLSASADELAFVLKKQDGSFVCLGTPNRQQPGASLVVVVPEGVTSDTSIALHARFKNSKGETETRDLATTDQRKTFTATVAQADLFSGATIEVFGLVDTKPVNCTPPSQGPSQGAPPSTANDTEALKFWNSDAGRQAYANVKKGDFPKGTTFLVHLPSGAAASPFPESVSEDTYLQVLVIEPSDSAPYTLQLTTCPKRGDFRVLGDLNQFQSAFGGKKEGLTFDLLPSGRPFRCGPDEVVYHPQPAGNATAAADTHLRVRPIYQVATTFMYVFDFAKQTTFSVESSKVAKAEDKVGPGLMVGFTWFPFGLDLEDVRPYNHWFNLFGVVDPKNPTESFAVGDSLTWRGGLSLALGASFHKQTVLNGVAVGDNITPPGDVPTRKQWTRRSIGFFVGVALDSNAYKTLTDFLKK
jgi:hypothetical protein